MSSLLVGRGSFINHVDIEGGRGVSQMSISQRKPYFVKLSTMGEGGVKMSTKFSTWFMDALSRTSYIIYANDDDYDTSPIPDH